MTRILTSMNSYGEGAPHGVPADWSWALKPSMSHVTPPAGMSAITSWGQIYADTTNVHPAKRARRTPQHGTYVWSNSRHAWSRVQGTARVDGAHFVEDFAGNAAVPTDLRNESDGGHLHRHGLRLQLPLLAHRSRGNLSNPADIGGVFTTLQARSSSTTPTPRQPQPSPLPSPTPAPTGGATSPPPTATAPNNPGVGQGRFTYLTSNWTALDFYTGGPIATAPGSWTEANSPAIHRHQRDVIARRGRAAKREQ